MKRLTFFFAFLIFTSYIKSQSVGVGHWAEHLAYSKAISVAQGQGKVYCATTGGLFVYTIGDNSMEHLSKVDGFSDVEASVVNFNKNNNKLLIAYKNSNIDILDNGSITNLADIKRKAIIGNKSINNIYFIGHSAYLSCAFGIVVIDMDKNEVKDTYYIGTNGKPINVRDIASDSNYIYAATDTGIYKASLNNPNLANYSAWSLIPGLPAGIYNAISSIDGKIVANFSKYLMNASIEKDTLFVCNNGTWSHFGGSGYVVNSIKQCNDDLIIAYDSAVTIYDTNLVIKNNYTGYFSDNIRAKQAILDGDNTLWIADIFFGLVSVKNGNNFDFRYPNGPNSVNVNAMCMKDDQLWVAPGGGNGTFYNDGIYTYNGEYWNHIYGNHPSVVNFDSIYDIMNVLIDPIDPQKAYAAWGNGLIEFTGAEPVKVYNESNSTLKGIGAAGGYNPIWVEGLGIDADDNLWVANSGVPNCLSQKKPDGTWQALNFSSLLGTAPNLTRLLVDKSDQKWVILYRNGLMVYNGTTAAPNTSNTKVMTTASGNGALPSLNVICLAEDKDGEIWIGTDKGIGVFYSPSSLFSGQNYDAQQILVEQDGNAQILLETELVQSIAIDGANRKWIATKSSGVFLMSADGTKQVYHFEENNSPLLSNDVRSIVINPKTGEVYFGTSKGIIAFRGTATEGLDEFTNVYAFPNPVKPTYEGPIAIKGLMNNSTVKITDISGAMLFETKSEGGQAIWNGKNTAGQRVSTGVYMVFCTSEDGAKKIATKILFIN